MQLYVKDAVTDTGHLPSDAFKGYWLLTFKAWAGVEGQEQGYLPGDDTRLQEMSGLQPRAWRAARPRILGLFRKTDDNRYYSKRGVEEAQRLSSISERRSQAGKDGAAARWRKPSPVNGNGTDLPMANDSSASASASAIPPHTPPSDGERVVDPDQIKLRLQLAEVEFDRLWNAYPEKGRKARHLAEREWAQAVAGGFAPPLAEVLDALSRQRRSDQGRRNVWVNLDRWIHEKRWADGVDDGTGGDGASARYRQVT